MRAVNHAPNMEISAMAISSRPVIYSSISDMQGDSTAEYYQRLPKFGWRVIGTVFDEESIVVGL